MKTLVAVLILVATTAHADTTTYTFDVSQGHLIRHVEHRGFCTEPNAEQLLMGAVSKVDSIEVAPGAPMALVLKNTDAEAKKWSTVSKEFVGEQFIYGIGWAFPGRWTFSGGPGVTFTLTVTIEPDAVALDPYGKLPMADEVMFEIVRQSKNGSCAVLWLDDAVSRRP